MRYDPEVVIKRLRDLYQSQLDVETACINAEKNDTIIMESIEAAKYVFGVITEDMLNFDSPFVMYGLEPTEPKEVQANNFIKEVKVSFRVVFPDSGNADREDEFFKLLRYQRALEAVIVKNFDVLQGYGKPMVKSLIPEAFEYQNKVFLNIGVEISASITAR